MLSGKRRLPDQSALDTCMTPRWALVTLMCLAVALVLALHERGRNAHWTTYGTSDGAAEAPSPDDAAARDAETLLARVTGSRQTRSR